MKSILAGIQLRQRNFGERGARVAGIRDLPQIGFGGFVPCCRLDRASIIKRDQAFPAAVTVFGNYSIQSFDGCLSLGSFRWIRLGELVCWADLSAEHLERGFKVLLPD